MGTTAPPLKRMRTGMLTEKKPLGNLSNPPENTIHAHGLSKRTLKVQECSFIRWHVSGITSTAATQCGRYLAVARLNGNIELRDEKTAWATVSLLYSEEFQQGNNIIGMVFSNCGRYLFAAHLLGVVEIIRITQDGMERHTTLRPAGGAIWDIAVNRCVKEDRRIAIASDDGCVRIITPEFSFGDNETEKELPSNPIHYETMASQKSAARVLSLGWYASSSNNDSGCIVCGDEDGGIRWLNPSTGSLFGRGKIPATTEENAMVWTVQLASNGSEVICGDSRGLATVWSSSTNTMTAEIKIEGMLGALWSSAAVSDDAGSQFVFFGAAGGGVGGLRKGGDDDSWTPIRAGRLHTHDVRTMCKVSRDNILSGSVDCLMRLFTPTSLLRKRKIKWIRPYNECVEQQPIQFCPANDVILARIGKSLEIWSLKEDANQPSLLLRMNINSISGDLRACAISGDCRKVAVSAVHSFKMYEIWNGDGKATESTSFGKVVPMKVCKSVHSLVDGCNDMAFGHGFLVCITACRRRVVFLKNDSYLIANHDDFGVRGSYLRKLSCKGSRVAICDTRGNIYRCDIEEDSIESSSAPTWLPALSTRDSSVRHVTALAFSESGKKLALFADSGSAIVLDFESGSRKVFELSAYCSSVAHSVSFSENEKSILTAGHDFCIICTDGVSAKRKTKDKGRITSKGIHVLPYTDSIISASIMGKSRITIVSRKWLQVMSSLPDAIPKKMYHS